MRLTAFIVAYALRPGDAPWKSLPSVSSLEVARALVDGIPSSFEVCVNEVTLDGERIITERQVFSRAAKPLEPKMCPGCGKDFVDHDVVCWGCRARLRARRPEVTS